jgi:hypothetical protein
MHNIIKNRSSASRVSKPVAYPSIIHSRSAPGAAVLSRSELRRIVAEILG